MQHFSPAHPNQLFCCDQHRAAWRARDTKRGRQSFGVGMVARITRDGTRGDKEAGKQAAAEYRALLQRWKEEDAEAGRMPWPQYLKRRKACGFDPLT